MLLAFVLTSVGPASAQSLRIIRDAEIEREIRRMSAPLFLSAGLVPSSVSIHIVQDKSLNAFVANGQRMFMNTGLLMQAENVGQVIGVIAHETGHISGGHLARLGRALDQGATTSLLATFLGLATAVGTGRGDVGAAVAAGGQTLATRNFFSFTRTQESSADQAALSLLDETKQSARGLLTFMQKLEGQELLITDNQDPYVRTHPLSEERVNTIAAHVARSPYSDTAFDPSISMGYERIKAKLRGYFDAPQTTIRFYPETDTSVPARYARAFAYSKIPDTKRAIAELDSLLTDVPDDPFFLEFKAQVLFQSGDVEAALPAYRRSVEIAPDEPLIRTEFSRALIATERPAELEEAVTHLRHSLSLDRRSRSSWQQLGIAYGKLGDVGRSSLALAESALLRRDAAQVRFHAGRAETMFARGSPEWLQSQDLLLAVAKDAP